jgi:hypothetical protein
LLLLSGNRRKKSFFLARGGAIFPGEQRCLRAIDTGPAGVSGLKSCAGAAIALIVLPLGIIQRNEDGVESFLIQIDEKDEPCATFTGTGRGRSGAGCEQVEKRLRKKGRKNSEDGQNHPSAAKAVIDVVASAARLKPCPFKTVREHEFFRSL